MDTETIELFEKLKSLCIAWRSLARPEAKKGWTYLENDFIGFYFAENSDHTAVQVGSFDVSFHSSPTVTFKLSDLPHLEELISRGWDEYGTYKDQLDSKTEAEKDAARQAKRDRLMRELAELEQVA